jgi:hypothetical protein
MSVLERRYRFLAKSSHQLLFKDAANVSAANTSLVNAVLQEKDEKGRQPPILSVLELNNKLI